MPLKTIILTLSALWLALANARCETTTNSNGGQFFKFKFELNKPMIYAIARKSRAVSDVSGSGRNSLTRNSSETRFKIRLTAINTNSDGTTTVFYEPFDFEQDGESVGAAGQINTTTRGLNIVVKQNGIVTIDTARSVGMAQAKNAKYPVYPMLLSGYLNIDDTGYVKSLDGDLPFIDQWQENLKYSIGFFGIVFSTNIISSQDSWTNYLTLKNFGAFYLDRTLIQTNIFARGIDSATNTVSFSLFQSGNGENFTGYIEQMGQRTSAAMPNCLMSKSATFLFNRQLGRIISVKQNEKMDNTTSIISQAGSATGHDNVELESSMTLVTP
jgi:hypothetical protein